MLTTTGSKTMGFSEVSTLLWREREALQLLLFKLVEEQLIVSAGHTRWLAQANDEIEAALDNLRGTEVLRAAEVDVIADELGLPAPPTLAELATLAPEPWGTLFGEHRQALLKLVAEVEGATGHNRALLAAGARAVRQTLLSVTESVQTYDSQGSAAATPNGPMLMDEQA
ncbi:MAG TPA: flagellar export chaperone FlgN [Jatrophihabitans sp.]|uniref:flagellar export chaperone FlgN n=1 Tax=Jatrophihabitans sp. TaxID=1932789 RepID=UPI002F0CF4DE